MRRSRLLLFSAVVTAAFFAGAEAILRLAGAPALDSLADPAAGFSRAARVFELDAASGQFLTSPRAARHSFNHQQFAARKPQGGLRIFVLGGSSAYGFPWGAEAAFAAALERALRATHPGRAVEVINAAGMSYGSHRLGLVAEEVLEHEPDALIVYEAHNEFVEEALRRRLEAARRPPAPVRALLHRSRLYSAMAVLLGRGPGEAGARDGGGATAGELLGLDVARESAAGATLARKREAEQALERNLAGLVRQAAGRGTRVVLCTVASNQKDWPPNQSLFEQGTPASARKEALDRLARAGRLPRRSTAAAARMALLEEAERIAPEYAEIPFRLGRAFEELGWWDDARAAYRRAADRDAQPARALSSFNQVIRRVAQAGGADLVDVERLFEQEAPRGLVGFELIEDYVHPTPSGHRLIARALWELLAAGADPSVFERAVGEWDASPPDRPGAEGEKRRADRLYNTAVVLEKQGLAGRAAEMYEASLLVSPGHKAAAYNLGRILHEGGRPDLAAPRFRQALAADPADVPSMVGLGLSLAGMGRLSESLDQLRHAARSAPGHAAAWSGLGTVLALSGDLAEAAGALREAARIDPGDAVSRARLGSILLRQGRAEEAIAILRQAVAIRHDLPHARHDLADALRAAGRPAEAAAVYRELLADDPADHRALAGLESAARPPR
ncbi:MAG TPA: tetratricopeptide repeat protein [Candidatus Polarisedimenticolia bacterium]|nr:tetratricopeptide repeat protein [Candidatus Polarisedimenticolia bacterium]